MGGRGGQRRALTPEHRHRAAGHNLSLARTAPAYHQNALTFADHHLPTPHQPA
ncbi:hypothetical protein ACFVTO_29105 [Streptomyces albidoflavus]